MPKIAPAAAVARLAEKAGAVARRLRKRPAGDEDEPSDFMRRFRADGADGARARVWLVAASKARQEALDAAARADDASIERLLALERLPPGSRVAVPASDGYADRPAHGEVVHGHPPPPGYRVAPPGKMGLAERPHNSRPTMGEIQYLKLHLGAPTDEVRHREARRAQREREEPWRLGAQARGGAGGDHERLDGGDVRQRRPGARRRERPPRRQARRQRPAVPARRE